MKKNGKNDITTERWRETSIKTRIETCDKCGKELKYQKVEERHPLKQGLKQITKEGETKALIVEERHPLKQGLKPLKRDIH